jgi:hypothetical protein
MVLSHDKRQKQVVHNENFIAQLRAKLGDAAFEEAWSSGQAMSLEQALAMGNALP